VAPVAVSVARNAKRKSSQAQLTFAHTTSKREPWASDRSCVLRDDIGCKGRLSFPPNLRRLGYDAADGAVRGVPAGHNTDIASRHVRARAGAAFGSRWLGGAWGFFLEGNSSLESCALAYATSLPAYLQRNNKHFLLR